MAKSKLLCHHCRRLFTTQHGGDLTCSPDCRAAFAQRREEAILSLRNSGFQPVAGFLNLWEKGGVHISLEQVIREGLVTTIERHAEAVAYHG